MAEDFGLFLRFLHSVGIATSCIISFLCRSIPNILFGPNSGLNSVFVFGRMVLQKIDQIWIISIAPSSLIAQDCI